MIEPSKAYSRRQLITVAEVANTLAASRNIAGLEAVQQLAEAVQAGMLCPDVYPPHQPWQHGGDAKRIGKPSTNSPGVWNSLAAASAKRHMGDKDDFNYPPAASTWHVLADDVMEFAGHPSLHAGVCAALRDLAARYKPELTAEPPPKAEASGNPIKSTSPATGETHQDAHFRNTLWLTFAQATPGSVIEQQVPEKSQAPAQQSAGADSAGPLPLTTGDVAHCFAGVRWTEEKRKKPLGDLPKWLESCLVIHGQRGVSERRWNPVSIGAALVRQRYKSQNGIRALFQTKAVLKPWFEAWKTYEAEYLDTP